MWQVVQPAPRLLAPEPRRLLERHVPAGQGAGEPQHVGDGVHQQRRPVGDPDRVDDGPVLLHRDLVRLRAGQALLGKFTQHLNLITADRGTTGRQ